MAKKIKIHYRAPSHVPLWKVMEEGGFLEKHGLEMEMDRRRPARVTGQGLEDTQDALSASKEKSFKVPCSRLVLSEVKDLSCSCEILRSSGCARRAL